MPSVTKVAPSRLRKLTVRHTGSGAMKAVTYLGIGTDDDTRERSPSRLHAIVHWPLAGDYEIDPTTGKVLGLKRQNELDQGWKLEYADLCFVQEQRHIEIERRKSIAREEPTTLKDA